MVLSDIAFTVVRRLSGSHRLDKLLMYLERYATICRDKRVLPWPFGGLWWHGVFHRLDLVCTGFQPASGE